MSTEINRSVKAEKAPCPPSVVEGPKRGSTLSGSEAKSEAITPQRLTSALSKIIHQINRLEKTEHDLIALLPALPIDEVIEARDSVRLIQCTAWKIEIACDAEIWDRTVTNLASSGVKDVDEKGIMAAVNKRAKEIGCSASNVRANARLFRRFAPVLSTYQGLEDKGFYQAAMKADDPEAALESFAEKKMANPHFRPADAWREVLHKDNDDNEQPDPDLLVLQDPEVRAWLEDDKRRLREQYPTVPLSAGFLRTELVERIEADDWQLGRTPEGDCDITRQAVSETLGTWQQVFNWLKEHRRLISPPDVRDRLASLIADGRIKEEEEEGRKVGQRGSMKTVYLPIQNPVDDAKEERA